MLFGSLLSLGKNLPSPRFKMNLFMDYDVHTGKVVCPKELAPGLSKLSALLQGIPTNNNIAEAEFEVSDISEKDVT